MQCNDKKFHIRSFLERYGVSCFLTLSHRRFTNDEDLERAKLLLLKSYIEQLIQ
jgi:hypothetical protein